MPVDSEFSEKSFEEDGLSVLVEGSLVLGWTDVLHIYLTGFGKLIVGLSAKHVRLCPLVELFGDQFDQNSDQMSIHPCYIPRQLCFNKKALMLTCQERHCAGLPSDPSPEFELDVMPFPRRSCAHTPQS